MCSDGEGKLTTRNLNWESLVRIKEEKVQESFRGATPGVKEFLFRKLSIETSSTVLKILNFRLRR